ncbi:hypothetical protein HanXRQr2_Chr04g0154461 [Helianthus annuus]|uniref:Uncharacterized protein n=1 Tax=Helianthus annuus TaxID=4232 RepID=A0A251UX14_HELAN|nr:hypothetical protein HanXRQr2_Chr04g0154461 [Helianthus annuus]KAJ0587720.1 hypothetical protein HanIR_Chr04g0166401 [Helianthus annuus]
MREEMSECRDGGRENGGVMTSVVAAGLNGEQHSGGEGHDAVVSPKIGARRS